MCRGGKWVSAEGEEGDVDMDVDMAEAMKEERPEADEPEQPVTRERKIGGGECTALFLPPCADI